MRFRVYVNAHRRRCAIAKIVIHRGWTAVTKHYETLSVVDLKIPTVISADKRERTIDNKMSPVIEITRGG